MIDDQFGEMYAETIQVGLDNLAVLQLAADWCQNIGVTKGPMGTGLMEQLTGLPISGGSLRCDFAKAPQSFGMQLKMNAIAFYNDNCVGCPHRAPTDAKDHLGTWASSVATEAAERERQIEEAQQRAAEARSQRRATRHLLYGQPDAILHSILDLVDRVDDARPDPEASQLLLKHAEMSPDDFPDSLVDHLATEAMAIGNGTLLEAVIAIFERQGRPSTGRMLDTSFEAVANGIASRAAGRVIAAHATRFDRPDEALDGLVRLAAGEDVEFGSDRTRSEPASLLRCYDIDPRRAVRLLSTMLRAEDPRVRADAAHATEKVIAARPDSGVRILPALLDSLALPDTSQYAGDPFAASQAEQVVAELFLVDPLRVARRLNTRLRTAEPAYARRLWGCYDRAARGQFGETVPDAVIQVVVQRSIRLLRTDADLDLMREVSDTLESACRSYREALDSCMADLAHLIVRWATELESFDNSSSDAEMPDHQEEAFVAVLEKQSQRTQLRSILGRLEDCLGHVGRTNPDGAIESIRRLWPTKRARIAQDPFLRVIADIVRDVERFAMVQSMLLQALDEGRPLERGSALSAIGAISRRDMTVPDELSKRVLAAFDDDRLVVILGAIQAASRISVPKDRKQGLIVFLIRFVSSYGPQRLYAHEVEDAARLVLQLSSGEPYEGGAAALLLEAIATLPSGEIAELMSRLDLEHHPSWPKAAMRGLHLDTDPNWRGLRDRERQELLRGLALMPTERVAPFFEELERVAQELAPHGRTWMWAIADVLAIHGEHERAARVCDAYVSTLPDTRERAPERSLARQIALAHHANASTAGGDIQTLEYYHREWLDLVRQGSDV